MKIPGWTDRFIRWVEGEETQTERIRAAKGKSAVPGERSRGRAEEKARLRAEKEAVRAAEARTEKRSERVRRDRSEKEKRAIDLHYRVAAAFVCAVMIAVLVLIVSWLPRFGGSANAPENEVYTRYVEEGLREAGAVNIVADMILDYRAFDTLGESNVLFIAVCSVMILLRVDRRRDRTPDAPVPAAERDGEKEDPILRAAVKVLLPAGLLFGIYVILNGHLSAGGGFSGGAVIGGCMILYVNACGCEKLERFFTVKSYQWITFASLITYTLLKAYSFYTGANDLESGIPLGTPGAILSSGLILPLNICVGLVVACTMYAFYALFSKGGFGHDQ